MNKIKAYGYCLKINTVVSTLNHGEDMKEFIAEAAPDRWKIFQCLIVKGQNDHAASLAVSHFLFEEFIQRHSGCHSMVVEDAESMKGSYIMIDPQGRPYGNAGGSVVYGKPVLEAGFIDQLTTLGYSQEKAVQRGADYF
jgi:radical S-adenosyl methionine domain-containing protein 2